MLKFISVSSRSSGYRGWQISGTQGRGDLQDGDLDRDKSPSGGESHKGPQAALTTGYKAFTLSKDTWREVLAFQDRRGISSMRG